MSFFTDEYQELHNEYDQLRRQKSSLSIKLDEVDFLNQTGRIKKYVVSLDECTCTDFIMRQKPCKHMYKLACELGVFQIDDKAKDKNLPASSINSNTIEDETRQIRNRIKVLIRPLSAEAQLKLQEFTYSPKKKIYELDTDENIDVLIDRGLLISHEITPKDAIARLTIAEIRKMCINEKPKKSFRRDELIEFFLENYSAEAEGFRNKFYNGKVFVELSKEILENLTAIHRFLCSMVGAVSERY